MKRLVLVSLILVTVLITGVMPQTVYGADSERSWLTGDEQKFVKEMDGRITQAATILTTCYLFTNAAGYHNYQRGNFLGLNNKTDIEKWRDFKSRLNFDFDCKLDSAPSTFKQIQTDWNTNICPKFGQIRLVVEREFVPSITFEGWLALGEKIGDDIDYLSQLMDNVMKEYKQRKEELPQQRAKTGIKPQAIEKEVKEEIKKEQSKKDEAGKAEDDSDDLFDLDCFIATAAYGTPSASEINELRRFRDEYLRESFLGNEFIKFYYTNSPPIAKYISEHELLRAVVREGFVDPVVKIVEFTENWWTD